MELKLEIVVIPVADTGRAKDFYEGIGFRLDADFSTDKGLRVVQATPPGSAASVIFGDHLTTAEPGTAQGLHLITPDIVEARNTLIEHGVAVSEPWHDADGIFHWADETNRVPGPHPATDSYGTYASFSDPDGNSWTIQQIVTRAPGR
ncbi:Predicted lactoylglutathione lyase [Leifsonia sp. 98AMF]|uniref:VOC family protein n=1 Tax=unclassified Leifsonia TaxID=2663824 RepID=UPI00087CD153|nr:MULTISPECIES: VOC family protein [unclassified Leifsonia]SDH70331.1 Predicted lactoylglutathione lyase [Leifsonia sp. 197AMF]SDI69557.1 Predicted lactoylglutathione lyase [Leifsonia sp. 466MF]SDK21721.1 Predicted lactoylglutathione lyase [Leifsonia sp. 157MF]SDN71910.1 Predicted lactoylglutathione lyase [Leifsonia sp. 509MF]SEN36425.1 Predicted lactoylglutathione lyase [Leifsonia sp. 467MF]